LLYLSGVLWPLTMLSDFPTLMVLMKLNPLVYLIEGYRAAFFGTEWYLVTAWEYSLYFWGLMLVMLLIGSVLHVKFRRNFIDYLYEVLNMTTALITKNVVKKYKHYSKQNDRMLDLISPTSRGEDVYALNGVDFEADKGDVVGFIGINGSGKSTLSNIIAGIVPETSGEVQVNGQPALIAVAAGLNDDLTGRDNIELKCLMLGFSKDEIKELEPEIIEFAELENFIDQPVKSYSSGMKSRLGFAISVKVDPDILIIDE